MTPPQCRDRCLGRCHGDRASGGDHSRAAAPPGYAGETRPRCPRQLSSPFTGEPVPSLGPVLAVKIDNLAPARPQTGLTGADIVYAIPVEGRLSRLLAVFSAFPPRW